MIISFRDFQHHHNATIKSEPYLRKSLSQTKVIELKKDTKEVKPS